MCEFLATLSVPCELQSVDNHPAIADFISTTWLSWTHWGLNKPDCFMADCKYIPDIF